MQVIAVDITGPFPESNAGNRYIIVVRDYFSKWIEAYSIPDQEAKTVATKLVDEFFCRYSSPELIHSDQGKQFESQLMLKIAKTRTTAYHSQCDGLVERFNRTLKHMLATTLKNHPFDREQHLNKVCIMVTPVYIHRQVILPLPAVWSRGMTSPCGTRKPQHQLLQDYVAHMRQCISDAH